MKRFTQIVIVAIFAMTLLGADGNQQRFEKVGHRLMCTCGCNQILLECNHVGCPSSDGMRNELSAGLQKSSSDVAVLDTFVAKYGPIVLAAPTMTGFNRVAWIMPYAMFVFGIGMAAFVVQHWRHKPAAPPNAATPEDAELEEFRKRARKDTEE